MANWSKQYTKTPVNITKLELEIVALGLTPALVGSDDDYSGSDNLEITFDAEVTGGELTSLDAAVAAHDGAAATYYTIFCYDCGCAQGARALSTLTACPVCSGTDIQAAYHNDNLDATTDPTVDDDGTQGYCEGSHWLNVSTGKAFVCLDNATGAAVWNQLISFYRKEVAWSSEKDADLEVAVGTHRIPILFAGTPTSITIKSIRAMVGTVPTGATIIVDIHKNGTTIFTTQGNRPTIAISANDSGEVTNMNVTTLAKGDYLTMDIDQIGSGDAGKDLVVVLEAEVNP